MAPRPKPEPSAREAKEMLMNEVIDRLTSNLTEEQRDHLRARALPMAGTRSRGEAMLTPLHRLAPVHPRTPRASALAGEPASEAADRSQDLSGPPAPRTQVHSAPPASALSFVNEGKRRVHQIPSGTAKLVATPGSATPVVLDSGRALRLARPLGEVTAAGAYASEVSNSGGLRRSDAEARVDLVLIDLVGRLDEERVERLQKHFEARDGLLTEVEFVDVIASEVLEHKVVSEAPTQVLGALSAIFKRIDLSGRGSIKWAALTTFLAGAMPTSSIVNATTYFEEVAMPSIPPRVARHADRIFYMAPLNALLICAGREPVASIYYPCKQGGEAFGTISLPPSLDTLTGHTAPILAAACISEMGLIITSGADAVICWWDVATAAQGRKWKLRQREALEEATQSLCWWGSGCALFTGGVDGTILPWRHPPEASFMGRIESGPRLGSESGYQARGVGISALILASGEKPLLCSASLDGFVRLWDVAGLLAHFGNPPVCVLSYRAHERGVVAADVSRWCGFLFTAGLDHTVKVWSPLSDHNITTFREHAAPLVSLSAMEGTPQVVTADQSGGICVYDVRTLTCIQLLRVDVPNTFYLTSIATISTHRQIVVAAHSLTCFEAEPPPHPEKLSGLGGSVYNRGSHTIATFAGHGVTVWDASTGSHLRNFSVSDRANAATAAAVAAAATFSSSSSSSATATIADLSGGNSVPPITWATLDALGRRLVVGNAEGEVIVLDYATGALLFSYQAHTAEVSFVAHSAILGIIVSTSHDRKVTLYAETGENQGNVPSGDRGRGGNSKTRPYDSMHHGDIMCAALSLEGAAWSLPGVRLATGAEDGSLHYWSLDGRGGLHFLCRLGAGTPSAYRTDHTAGSFGAGTASTGHVLASGKARTAHRAPITALVFFDTKPLLSSADASGYIHLWYVGGLSQLMPGLPPPVGCLLTLRCPSRGLNRYPPLESPPWDPIAVASAGPVHDVNRMDEAISTFDHPRLDDAIDPMPSFFVTSVGGVHDGAEIRALSHDEDMRNTFEPSADGEASESPSFLPQPTDCAATCLAFASVPGCLLVGDELGRISSWDVSELLDAFDLPTSPMRSSSLAYRARRKSFSTQSYPDGCSEHSFAEFGEPRNSDGLACQRAVAFSTADAIRLHGKAVRLVNVWQAHPSDGALREAMEQPGAANASMAVLALTPIEPCNAVLSCGADELARVWASDGAPLGRLLRGHTTRLQDWGLRLNGQVVDAAVEETQAHEQSLKSALQSDRLLRLRAKVDAPPPPPPALQELMSTRTASRKKDVLARSSRDALNARSELHVLDLSLKRPDPVAQRALSARLSQPSPRIASVSSRVDHGAGAEAATRLHQLIGLDMHRAPLKRK